MSASTTTQPSSPATCSGASRCNTLIWTLASTLIAFVLGFAAALALHRDFIGRGILRAILIIPWVISAVAASYIWKWIYHSDFGIIGAVLVGLGLADRPPNFIDSVSTVLPSLIVVNIWREFPFAMIMMMAGLQTVPDQLLRAAQVDGASAWQRFWHVTFPHLSKASRRSRSCCSQSPTSTPSSSPGS